MNSPWFKRFERIVDPRRIDARIKWRNRVCFPITALSEKMPILPKLNRAIRLPELFASGNRWTLPADNAFDAKSIVRRG
ncbi:MAG: hypothetical protein L6306_04540, partial [Planctomycetales bacterium]|nr:hypothetical protein [Planctomycetales bacterium]